MPYYLKRTYRLIAHLHGKHFTFGIYMYMYEWSKKIDNL